ncbi:autotransporter outer membrane beta-barrel domain-containing protein [Archangium lansingense]|uniref:autotransporter outer membrane beta-barrel domain-containing protein n=1 Tax=Archangium lansingense TaxID=2995310 RepID=UPI003B7FEF7E
MTINPRGGPATPGLIKGYARCARAVTCLLMLALAPGARAQQDPDDLDMPASETEGTVVTPSTPDADAVPPWQTRYGVRLAAGAPEGVGLSAVIHPRRWARAHVGATRNTLGFGARGGLSLIPLELIISPLLELEYGYYFNADYEKLLTQLHGQPTTPTTGIRRVGYHQVAGSVGLQFSPSRYVTLFGGVGISYWFIEVANAKAFISEAEDDPEITARPLNLGLSSPVAKLGLLVYFN